MLLFNILSYTYTSALFVVVTSIVPSPPVTLILYDKAVSWNDARRLCKTKGEKLARVDTAAKAEAFHFLKDLSTNSKYWIGLHKSGWSNPEYVWLNCGGLGEFTLVDSADTSSGNCVAGREAIHHTWVATPCSEKLQFVCEKPWGTRCTFDAFSNTAMDMSQYPGISVVVETANCEEACLSYVNDTLECWAYTVYRNDLCTLYIDAEFGVVQDEKTRKKTSFTTFYRKVCFDPISGTTSTLSPADLSDAPGTKCWLNTTLTSTTADPTVLTTTSNIEDSTVTSSDTPFVNPQSSESTSDAVPTTTNIEDSTLTSSDIPFVNTRSQEPSSEAPRTYISSSTYKYTFAKERTTSLSDNGSKHHISITTYNPTKKRNKLMPYFSSTSISYNTKSTQAEESSKAVFQRTAVNIHKSTESHRAGFTEILKSSGETTASTEGEQSTDLSTTPKHKVCHCKCLAKTSTGIRTEVMGTLLKSLHVPKEQLSSFRRKRTSASDTRESSVACGLLGITLISMVFGVIILTDITSFYIYLKSRHWSFKK